MMRIDLDGCGIPYIVQGADGPLFADFHCLRHSFVAMLDRSGATLKEAMQLARHSDPRLTMAIYGRARMHDLAGAVDRLPSLGSPPEMNTENKTLASTGTDGKPRKDGTRSGAKRLPFPCCDDDETCGTVMENDEGSVSEQQQPIGSQVIGVIGLADACRPVMKHDKRDADRSRTDFEPGCSRLPGRPAPASNVLGRIRTCSTTVAKSRAIPLHYEDFCRSQESGVRSQQFGFLTPDS